MTDLWVASLLVLWVVVGVMAFLLAGALRQLGILHMRLGNDPGMLITDTGLDRGTQAPDFEAIDVETRKVVKMSELPSRARVLTFVTPTCISCQEMIPHLNEMFETRSKEFDFQVICRGSEDSCRTLGRMSRLKPPMLIDDDGSIEAAYQVRFTPFTYFLDHEGRVLVRGIANDWRHLESLLDQEGTLESGMSWTPVASSGS